MVSYSTNMWLDELMSHFSIDSMFEVYTAPRQSVTPM